MMTFDLRLSRTPAAEQATLGRLITRLAACNPDVRVVYDFPDMAPNIEDIGSWRGIYAELAIGHHRAQGENAPTVADLLAALRAAVGATFEGYKGGDYVMSESTPVWVSNYGCSDHTAVTGVIDHKYEVVLTTALMDPYPDI
jgi:hypothetical protein